MAPSKWKELPLAACAEARTFFSPEIAEQIRRFDPEVDAPEHLATYLTYKVLRYLREHREHDREHPESVDDFIETVSPAFHKRYLKQFEENCDNFNRMAGSSVPPSFLIADENPPATLSEVFLRDMGFDLLVAEICMAIALRCYKIVSSRRKLARLSIPQFDGPSDTPASQQHPPQAGVFDNGGPFKQVTLVGPDLCVAWNRLPFTRNLENSCPQSSTWTPSQPGGMYVYHGTAAHLSSSDAIRSLNSRSFQGLTGSSGRNQITHGKRTIPVVWTAFSPFRAFLWAAFRAEVVQKVPGPHALFELNQAWRAEGNTYYGVLVLQFGTVQPSPPGCTWYTIPRGEEKRWCNIAYHDQSAGSSEPTPSLWARFAGIHNQEEGTDWPHVVHGLEMPESRQTLRPFTGQYWRTAWFGQGIQKLNSSHEQSLAIRFVPEPDTSRLPDNSPGSY